MDLLNVACCGVREINRLSSYDEPKAALKAFCDWVYVKPPSGPPRPIENPNNGVLAPKGNARFRYAFFTQATYQWQERGEVGSRPRYYGVDFAAFIKEHELGQVVIATGKRGVRNPNTENLLKMWVWTVDHYALQAWYKNATRRRKKTDSKSTSVNLEA